MSAIQANELFMPPMRILGGEKMYQRFMGPERAAERRSLYSDRPSVPDLEYGMTYFVRTNANEIYLCYFYEARLTFMRFEYPFHARFWHTIPERCVAGYKEDYEVTSYLKHQGCLPIERLTLIEEPRIPTMKPRGEDEVRYGDPPYVIVMGKFAYESGGKEKYDIFPCVYLGNGRWHNDYLIEPFAYMAPESWCYLEDLLVNTDLVSSL